MRHLIVDSHVIMKTGTVEQVYNRMPANLRPGYLRAIIDYVSSGIYLGTDEPTSVTWVFDWKDSNRKYWRHYQYETWLDTLRSKGQWVYTVVDGKELRRKRAPYKYGRGLPNSTTQKYYKAFRKALKESGTYLLGQYGFEADDIAGELVRTLPAEDTATLVTIDSDWLGLVSEGKVDFYNIINYQPDNRWRKTLADVLNTSACRGKVMTKPSDIWEIKHLEGDASDRLLPGTPLGLISLLEPSMKPNPVELNKSLHSIDGERASAFLDSVGFHSYK